MPKFNLGDKVRDLVTGFSGIVVGHTVWLTGCDTYVVNPQVIHEGKPVQSTTFDDHALELIEKEAVKLPDAKAAKAQKAKVGGPERVVERPDR